MLKAWRKSCGKQYQHFKVLKDQCEAFNGGEKPFVHAWRAVLGFEGSLDCHIPGVRLTHSWWAASKYSSPASVLHGCGHRCAASLQRQRQSHVHSCKDMPALRCRGFNVWSRLNRVPLWRLEYWSAFPHRRPILSAVCMFVHECCGRCHTYTLAFSKEWTAQLDTSQSH